MRNLTFIIGSLLLAAALNGCAGGRAPVGSFSRQPPKQMTAAEARAAELRQLAKAPVPMTVVSRQGKSRTERDGSRIETLYDAFGNKVESRIFRDDPLLQMVVLKTAADGQKQAFVYANNGDVKIAPEPSLDSVLASAAGEIARSVEVYEGRRPVETLAEVAPVEPNQTNYLPPAINYTAPAAQENAAAIEPEPTETAAKVPVKSSEAEKKNSKAARSEDAASRLRASLQNFKPNRPRLPVKN